MGLAVQVFQSKVTQLFQQPVPVRLLLQLVLDSFKITEKLMGLELMRPGRLLKSTCWKISRMKGRTGMKVPMVWDSSVRARTQCMRMDKIEQWATT